MNNPQEKISYALWMVRSAAKQSTVSTLASVGMMTAGWIILCHAAFGLHKPEEKLPWSIRADIIEARSPCSTEGRSLLIQSTNQYVDCSYRDKNRSYKQDRWHFRGAVKLLPLLTFCLFFDRQPCHSGTLQRNLISLWSSSLWLP